MEWPAWDRCLDTATLDKSTLVLRKQKLQQGPVNISLDFTDQKATGTMSMNGQDKPIAADLGGPLFAMPPAACSRSHACHSPKATPPASAISTCKRKKRS